MKQKKESNGHGRRVGRREERKKGREEKNDSKTRPVLVCHFCLVTSGLTGSTMSQNCHAYPQVLFI